jgi:hypothetical protein
MRHDDHFGDVETQAKAGGTGIGVIKLVKGIEEFRYLVRGMGVPAL